MEQEIDKRGPDGFPVALGRVLGWLFLWKAIKYVRYRISNTRENMQAYTVQVYLQEATQGANGQEGYGRSAGGESQAVSRIALIIKYRAKEVVAVLTEITRTDSIQEL
ncbi:hypothetical protein A0J61_06561, partial [Choanephora cucurbitarum]